MKAIHYVLKGQDVTMNTNKVNYVLKPNGHGKTTLLQAIRYGLSGILPSDIRDAEVEITLENGDTIYRSKKNGVTTAKHNNKKCSETNLNNVISNYYGATSEDMSIALNSDALLAKKPSELLALLMKYIPENLTVDTLLGFFDNPTEDVKDYIKKYFANKPQFGISDVNEAYKFFYEQRKSENAVLRNDQNYAKSINAMQPTRDRDTVMQELMTCVNYQQNRNKIIADNNNYARAVQLRQQQEAEITKLESMIAGKNFQKPDETLERKTIEVKERTLNEINQLNATVATLNSNNEMFTKTLNALSTNVCPISKKLVCLTDKTAVKDEIEKSITNNNSVIETLNKQIAEKQELITRADKYMNQLKAMEHNYNLYQQILMQIDTTKKNLTIVPEKPMPVQDDQLIDQKVRALQGELNNIDAWNNLQRVLKEIDALTRSTNALTEILNSINDKGIVKSKIINYYMNMFTETCNERVKAFPGYEIQLKADNGVKVFMKTPQNNMFISLNELSDGETIIASLIIMDMINQLSGGKILCLDRIEAIDEGLLTQLKAILENPDFQQNYDNIFVCGVNHPNIVTLFS